MWLALKSFWAGKRCVYLVRDASGLVRNASGLIRDAGLGITVWVQRMSLDTTANLHVLHLDYCDHCICLLTGIPLLRKPLLTHQKGIIMHNFTKFLCGDTVYLRPVEGEDLPSLCRWANDPEIRGLTGDVLPMSTKSAADFLEKIHKEPDRVWFSVVVKGDNRLIGEAGLLRMFHPWKTTDLTVIIGEKDCWGKGYGTETIMLLLDYAFGYLSFHRVAVGVVGFNKRALQVYEKVGFKKEGIQRDGYYYNHCYHDFVMMSILEDEFREKAHNL